MVKNTTQLISEALAMGLQDDRVWLSLLHADGTKSHIPDPDFLFTVADFSPEKELKASINILLADDVDPDVACRFPARILWLRKKLGVEDNEFAYCDGITEFFDKAPADRISLVYASENLTQPSSMMGHLFMKIEGDDAAGEHVEHAISYFTELNGINVPMIIIDSLIVGKDGFFTLSPYEEKLEYYLKREQRNVWEYQLNFSEDQRELVQLHIWELKQVRMTYLFNSYNCATLINTLISVAEPDVFLKDELWMTPVDVVKVVSQANLVARTSVIPSSKWRVRMLAESMDNANVVAAVDRVNGRSGYPGGQPSNGGSSLDTVEDAFLKLELASSYADFKKDTGELAYDEWASVSHDLDQEKAQLSEELYIDLSDYKTPTKTPPDSQVYAGLVYWNDINYLMLGFLPTSHDLNDDNSQFFGESELRLSDISVLVSLEDADVSLNEWQLYSMSSYVPYDGLTGGISGRFRFGLEQHLNEVLESHLAGNISGGIGYAYQPFRRVVLGALMGAGLGYSDKKTYVYGDPEVKLILNEGYSMKSIMTYHYLWNMAGSHEWMQSLAFMQAMYATDQIGIHLEVKHTWNSQETDTRCEGTVKYSF
jgi:hypothetical protein